MKYNTKRKYYKNITNLLVSVIALTGKGNMRKAQKTKNNFTNTINY